MSLAQSDATPVRVVEPASSSRRLCRAAEVSFLSLPRAGSCRQDQWLGTPHDPSAPVPILTVLLAPIRRSSRWRVERSLRDGCSPHCQIPKSCQAVPLCVQDGGRQSGRALASGSENAWWELPIVECRDSETDQLQSRSSGEFGTEFGNEQYRQPAREQGCNVADRSRECLFAHAGCQKCRPLMERVRFKSPEQRVW